MTTLILPIPSNKKKSQTYRAFLKPHTTRNQEWYTRRRYRL